MRFLAYLGDQRKQCRCASLLVWTTDPSANHFSYTGNKPWRPLSSFCIPRRYMSADCLTWPIDTPQKCIIPQFRAHKSRYTTIYSHNWPPWRIRGWLIRHFGQLRAVTRLSTALSGHLIYESGADHIAVTHHVFQHCTVGTGVPKTYWLYSISSVDGIHEEFSEVQHCIVQLAKVRCTMYPC